MSRLRHVARLGPLISIAVFVFSASAGAVQPPHQPCPVEGYPAVSCPVVNDNVVKYVLESRLAGIVATPGSPLSVTVESGVVTMSGPVGSEEQRELATYIAQTTKGVKGVQNLLVVQGPEAQDLRLTKAVVDTISGLPVNTSQVRVYVDRGVVTLSGIVNSELAKTQIEMAAQFVSGVAAVHSYLIVQSPGGGLAF